MNLPHPSTEVLWIRYRFKLRWFVPSAFTSFSNVHPHQSDIVGLEFSAEPFIIRVCGFPFNMVFLFFGRKRKKRDVYLHISSFFGIKFRLRCFPKQLYLVKHQPLHCHTFCDRIVHGFTYPLICFADLFNTKQPV